MSATSRTYFDAVVRHEIALWNAIDERLAAAGELRLGHLGLLRVVAEVENARVQDISAALKITVGAASKSTDRAEREGLVVRMPHPDDRRSSLVALTPAGRSALAGAERVFDEAFESIFAGVDAAEIERVSEAIHGLDSHLTRQAVAS